MFRPALKCSFILDFEVQEGLAFVETGVVLLKDEIGGLMVAVLVVVGGGAGGDVSLLLFLLLLSFCSILSLHFPHCLVIGTVIIRSW